MNYEKQLVAFIDILGFQKITEELENDEIKFNRLYEELTRWYIGTGNANPFERDFTPKKYMFSDNIAICTKQLDSNSIHFFLNEINVLCGRMAYYGFWTRGGIYYGNIKHDGQVIFGNALNEAYKIESQIALYPRIVVDEEAYTLMLKSTTYELHLEMLNTLLELDIDGLKYVNYIKVPSFCVDLDQYGKQGCHGGITIKQYHDELEKNIVANLNQYNLNLKVLQKLNYLHNKLKMARSSE